MDERDFAAEMHAVVDAELEASQIAVPILARELVEKLRANDPDLLSGWLDVIAPTVLGDYIGRRLSSRRALARVRAPRIAFAAEAERFESGDTEALVSWLETPYESADRSQKHLGLFDHADLEYAEGQYAERRDRNGFEAAFLGALKKKVTTGTVADHFSNEQIAAMRSSLKDA